jgi:diguanylate cyclase
MAVGSVIRPLLLVMQNSQERTRYKQLLKKYASEFPFVIEADNAEDTVRLVRELQPQACLLDNRVKGFGELSLLKSLRREYPAERLPLVVISDHQDDDLATLLQAGAQDYLVSGNISAAQLHAALRNAMHTSQLQKQLSNLAHYDALTGLLNRNLLYNRLAHAVGRCNRYSQSCALLLIDLNNFKPINDIYGYEMGDKVLQHVANVIRENCRSTDSPARLGGDEFLILLEQVDDTDCQKITEKIINAIETPFDIEGVNIHLTASAGVAAYPLAGNVEELLKHADEALFLAKRHSGGSCVNFSSEHKAQWSRQQQLERELSKAIRQGDLALVYQPIVCAKTYVLRRFEALSRWPRNDFAVGAPELISMVDRLNLIEPFHEWLFNTAFSQLRAWHQENIFADICLNIPANYCYSNSIIRTIENAMDRFAILPKQVELEITESTLMLYPERSVELLHKLHERGIKIAVDDFGTGYSSMSYLTQLPLDTLKIDKHFFLENAKNERNRKVIEAVTALGHSLGLEIIAEGVETQAELELAKQVGCDLLQGYYFGRPQHAQGDWASYFRQFAHIQLPPKH